MSRGSTIYCNIVSTTNDTVTLSTGTGTSLAVYDEQGRVFIGPRTGEYQQGIAIAIGNQAGSISQRNYSIAIGNQAGSANQRENSVALGNQAGYDGQGFESVAIGIQAGYQYQGNRSFAIGVQSGFQNQGNMCCAIGSDAGYQHQGDRALAIGRSAGSLFQGSNAVAIGYQAGYGSDSDDSLNQKPNAVAIGCQAGYVNQGENSIAIGYQAGFSNCNPGDVIIGTNINSVPNQDPSLYIKPIRRVTDQASGILASNAMTNEVYATSNVSLVNATITSHFLSGPRQSIQNVTHTGLIMSASATGNDISGTINCSIDGGSSESTIVIPFGTAFNAAPIVTLTCANSNSTMVLSGTWVTSTTTSFTIHFVRVFNQALNCAINYHVIG